MLRRNVWTTIRAQSPEGTELFRGSAQGGEGQESRSAGSASSKDKELADAQVMIEQLKKERSELEHQLIESRVHVKSRRET